MRKIHRLPQTIIDKIAAGEVIERPAYAVKELIENAIDARATLIEIQIEESGLKRITVIDNGEGMSKDDLEICFLPHTTSKLSPSDELMGIKTLGFRGEALSSIAAVSHMTLITRQGKDIGGRIIQIRGGIVEDSAPIGSPIGTVITAEGLFYSIPARKKFLKSAQTEFRHISDIVTRFGLSYPEVHFVLKHNKKTVLELPKKINAGERLKTLLGVSITDNLLPISFEDGHISIAGFIGKPQIAAKQNQRQFLFVNNRAVTDRMLSLAVKEAFGSLLPAAFTPVFVLQLRLPHEMVDVNIHPRKEQVTFLNSKQVFDAVKQAVTETLKENNITFSLAKFKAETSAKIGETTSFAAAMLKDTVLQAPDPDTVLSVARTYFVVATAQGIVLYDQHAVHERILFTLFKQKFQERKKGANTLQLPSEQIIELSLAELQLFDEYASLFSEMGFTALREDTGIRITAIPELLTGRNVEKIIRDMLSDLHEDAGLREIDIRSERMLQFLACRAAVKAGDAITTAQQKEFIEALEQTEDNATCPHGRPTRIAITATDLAKMFKR